MLEGSWAKALATATPLGAASLLGASRFPSAMSSKGENLIHFRTCDYGAIGVTPFVKASYLDYRRGFDAGRGFALEVGAALRFELGNDDMLWPLASEPSGVISR